MPIYTFKCPRCGKVEEVLTKFGVKIQHYCDGLNATEFGYPVMELVPSVPSPMQWGCRKGF